MKILLKLFSYLHRLALKVDMSEKVPKYNNEKAEILKKDGELEISDSPIWAFATIGKGLVNRDAGGGYFNKNLKVTGIAVADGIGGNEKVEVAAEFVVEFFKQKIKNADSMLDLNLGKLFKNCKIEFNNQFINISENPQFGTTLITLLQFYESNQEFNEVAYTGNGAVWHVKGNFNNFNAEQLFPWTAVNYLNPHSVEENGVEVLTNCFTLKNVEYFSGPTILKFTSDLEFGDIIILCTDGISSNDQSSLTKDGIGRLWVTIDSQIELLLLHLNEYFINDDITNKSLTTMLEMYLEKMRKANILEDDATLAVIINTKVIDYQKSRSHETKVEA